MSAKRSTSSKDLAASLNKLSIAPQKAAESATIADSWEDDADATDSGEDTDRPLKTQESRDYPSAPPPTPISPLSPDLQDARRFASPQSAFNSPYELDEPWNTSESAGKSSRAGDVRQEKTDAVAKRLIAGALGVRVPKKTDEQRAYDRAIREKVMRRKNEEKETAARLAEEKEKARGSVWED